LEVVLDAGIMAVMDIFMQSQDVLAEVIETIKKSHDMVAQISLDSPAEVLMMPENLSAEVVGPFLFEDYMRPY